MADRLPACFLADLIHAQMATGNFGKLAQAAMSWAKHTNDRDALNLFVNLNQQVADYWADTDDGTIRIALGPIG